MDYGPDWPPAAEPPAPKRLSLGQKCAAWVLFYAVLWAAGALVLAVLVPTGKNLDFPAPPAQGHTTDVTTTLPPHPATTPRHP